MRLRSWLYSFPLCLYLLYTRLGSSSYQTLLLLTSDYVINSLSFLLYVVYRSYRFIPPFCPPSFNRNYLCLSSTKSRLSLLPPGFFSSSSRINHSFLFSYHKVLPQYRTLVLVSALSWNTQMHFYFTRYPI